MKEKKHPVLERLIPRPRKIDIKNTICKTAELKAITICTKTTNTEQKFAEFFQKYFQTSISVVTSNKTKDLPKDGYQLNITEKEIIVYFNDTDGMLNALKTMRQLSETLPGNMRCFPAVTIEDWPARNFRGIHFCVFPETKIVDLEKNLRLAAYHKYNYAVIEFWGTFPFESHPEFCWSDMKLNRLELKRILTQIRELGLTPIPQFNILGHATASRAISGKHAYLYNHPEHFELFEPTLWSWCMSNPKTRSILKDLVLELHDFFDSPPYFHIGCDEAEDLATCHTCHSQHLPDLLSDYLNEFYTLFKAKNTKLIMWHDMLLLRDDPRWNKFQASSHRLEMQDFVKKLPKDIMIADWEYGIPPASERPAGFPTTDYFISEGFETVICPWDNEDDINSMCLYSKEGNSIGILLTTWHHLSGLKYTNFMLAGAYAVWNPYDNPKTTLMGRLATNRHMLEITQDMNLTFYKDSGYVENQIPANNHPHPLY